jgi:hypothetical protein
MKRSTFATCARTSVLALSVLLLPLATPTFAQPATPTPATRRIDTRAERDRTDLWGLLGLAGLLGLMGRRRPDTVQTYDTRARSRTCTDPYAPRKVRLAVGRRGTTRYP